MLKVALIAGDKNTAHCGVKDYTKSLSAALNQINVRAEVIAPDNWKLGSFPLFLATLRDHYFDVIHIQYPSIGFRGSLLPHLLGGTGAAKVSLVTVHEFSELPLMQRLSMHLFRLVSDRILFVSEFERLRYQASLKGIGAEQEVFPIGSNVPAFPSKLTRRPRVIYFGQLRPRKGLEDFVALASMNSPISRRVEFVVAGSAPERQLQYFRNLRESSGTSVEWRLNLSFEEVAELLAGSLAAYLPYPDGASFRRGSLLAALTNGLPVISTIGPATGALANELLVAGNPKQAEEHVIRLLENQDYARSREEKCRRFARQFSWSDIALRHKQVYEELIAD